MEYTIVTYGSALTFVLDIIVKHNIKWNNITLNEYCNGEVLDVLPNVKFRGQYKINIVYPTASDDVLKKLFGRSDCIYVDRLLHDDDIRRMDEHFGRLNLSFKDITYKEPQLFNIKTLECI